MPSNKLNPPARVDQVGSWLRPEDVLETYDSRRDDKSPENAARCRAIEDKAIAALVQRQLNLGLRSITDGEFRRAMFFGQFVEGLEGGQQTYIPEMKFFVPITTGKLRWTHPIMVDDFKFINNEIEKAGESGLATAKSVIPSPTMLHYGGATNTGTWVNLTSYQLAERKPAEGYTLAYKDDEEFFQDLIEIYRKELTALHQAGCRYVQFDDTVMAFLADPGQRELIAKGGDYTADTLFDKYIWLFNECIKFPGREDMTIVCHMCKGNYNSQYFLSGGSDEGYEPIAKRLFNEMHQDAYFMEWDDAKRHGSFAPLRHLPPNKTVVLGILSTKTPESPSKEELIAKVREAAKFTNINQLCISGQCGFASSQHGNKISFDDQDKKIKLLMDVAQELWETT